MRSGPFSRLSDRNMHRRIGHRKRRTRWTHAYTSGPSPLHRVVTVQRTYLEAGGQIVTGVNEASATRHSCRAPIRVLQKLGMQKREEREFAGLHAVMYELWRTRFVARLQSSEPNGLTGARYGS